MKRSHGVIVALIGTALGLGAIVAGCGSSTDVAASRQVAMVPFIPANDAEYIDAMVPHHQDALMMAQMELARGSSTAVKVIAQGIKDGQTSEIAMLKAARKALTGSDVIPAMASDPHMSADMSMGDMAGMSGAEVDAWFLEEMIPHHASAITMAHRAIPNLTRTDLKENARMVVAAQAEEIGRMQALRAGSSGM